MDSISQLTLGAAVTEAVVGKKAGYKAILWGMVAGTIPDLDMFLRPFYNYAEGMELHRGFSHSIIFAAAGGIAMGYLLEKLHKEDEVGWPRWSLAMFLAFFTHALLDLCTTWGTAILWPFSLEKYSLENIFVADPLYTVPMFILVIICIFLNSTSKIRRFLNYLGLALSTGYLGLTFINKANVNQSFEKIWAHNNIEPIRWESKPTPLNNVLWSGIAESENAFHYAYTSILDHQLDTMVYTVAKNQQLPSALERESQLLKLKRLSRGWYVTDTLAADTFMLYYAHFGSGHLYEEENNFFFGAKMYQDEQQNWIFEEESVRATLEGSAIKKALNILWLRLKGLS